MSISITKPFLKNCPGKTTRYPPSPDIPADWIRHGLTRKSMDDNVVLLDFSGYSINFVQKKPTRFFLLREFDGEVDDLTSFVKYYIKIEKEDLSYQMEASEFLNVGLDIIFVPKKKTVIDYQSNPNEKCIIYLLDLRLVNREPEYSEIKHVSVNDLENIFYNYRGKYSFRRVKPLWSARTDLECYLSGTHNPWPGDLDGLLWDIHKKRIITLLEYKTHNLNIDIKDEASTNYGQEDNRRFLVLRILRNYINSIQKSEINTLFIVWGTNPNSPHHKKIKIEIVDTQKWRLIDRPNSTIQNSIDNYIEHILNMS